MPDKKLYANKTIRTNTGANLLLKYYLLTSPENNKETPCYGLAVEKYVENIEWPIFLEDASIEKVTFSKKEAEHLLQLISQGNVTPVAFYEVLDNFIPEELQIDRKSA